MVETSNPSPSLRADDGHQPVVKESWTSLPTAEEMVQVDALVKKLAVCKSEGVNGVRVVINFLHRRVQPIKDRVHPATEYTGRGDPTRESSEPWEGTELYSRVVSLFSSDVDVLGAERLQGHSLVNPPDEVCLFLLRLHPFCSPSGSHSSLMRLTLSGHFQGLHLQSSPFGW